LIRNRMVKAGEGFFSSLGFAPLPETFWQRSQFTEAARPRGGVPCLRLGYRQCRRPAHQDVHQGERRRFRHHPPRAWPQLLPARLQQAAASCYLNGANDGFHEAIGDAVALSITPEYLVQIGLLDKAKVPSADKDTGLLLRQAMDKVAFLPFGLLVDKWRWQVFSGRDRAGRLQQWRGPALRRQYQGIVPPSERLRCLRSGREIPYSRQHALHPLFPRPHPAVPVLQGGVRCQAGLEGAAAPLLLLRQQRGRQKLNAMLEMGASKALARRTAGLHRQAAK
jgi:peptidyl-dipeptidase A